MQNKQNPQNKTKKNTMKDSKREKEGQKDYKTERSFNKMATVNPLSIITLNIDRVRSQ